MRAEACVLAAAVLLHGFAVPPAARGADARPAPALAAAAEVRQDPGLNELYAARGFAPLWGGSQEAEERRAREGLEAAVARLGQIERDLAHAEGVEADAAAAERRLATEQQGLEESAASLPARLAFSCSGHFAILNDMRTSSARAALRQSSCCCLDSWSGCVACSIASGLPSGRSRQPSPSRST